MPERLWYSPAHAAEQLDISLNKLNELMVTGQLESFNPPDSRSRRISHTALLAYAERAETAARAASSPVPARAASAVTL